MANSHGAMSNEAETPAAPDAEVEAAALEVAADEGVDTPEASAAKSQRLTSAS